MTFCREKEIKRTRKPHSCAGCQSEIEGGSSATYLAYLADGDFYAVYYHSDCRRAEVDWNDERGSWGEDFDCLYILKEDDEAEAWIEWLRLAYPAVAARLGVAE